MSFLHNSASSDFSLPQYYTFCVIRLQISSFLARSLRQVARSYIKYILRSSKDSAIDLDTQIEKKHARFVVEAVYEIHVGIAGPDRRRRPGATLSWSRVWPCCPKLAALIHYLRALCWRVIISFASTGAIYPLHVVVQPVGRGPPLATDNPVVPTTVVRNSPFARVVWLRLLAADIPY